MRQVAEYLHLNDVAGSDDPLLAAAIAFLAADIAAGLQGYDLSPLGKVLSAA